METKRIAAQGALLGALMLSAALPTLDTVAGWDATTYAGWPGIGIATLLLLTGDRARQWWLLGVQTVGLGIVLTLVYDVAWWQGTLATSAVTFPALLAARGLGPTSAAYRRFNEGEVDAYHGVTALAGLLCGVISAAAAAAAGRGDLAHTLLTGLFALFAAITAQLIIVPFGLRRVGGWRRLGNGVELWSQRSMFVVFTAGIFYPDSALPVVFLLFPILGWAAIRATVPETHLQVLVVSVVAFLATLAGRGPLAMDNLSAPGRFAPLVVYLFISSVCYLLIPLALNVERLTAVTRQATAAATTVQRMLDSATGTVFLATDPRGLITHCNPGAERALGYAAAELVGRPTPTLHSRAEVARQAERFGVTGVPPSRLYEATVGAQVATGVRSDWEFQRKDGQCRVISLTISTMTEPGGEIVGYIASGEDITERVRAEQALEMAFRREQASVAALRAADDVKQELVSTVSHELRTPITNITGFAEVLLDGDLGSLSARQHDAVDRIERNATRLRRLVEDLLTLSTAEAGALPMSSRTVDLNEVVLAAHELLAGQLRARHLTVKVAPALAPVRVQGDRELLERAVSNLWSNAIKFTPDGGSIELSAEATAARTADGRDGWGRVIVRDTGMGIPTEDQAEVFTRFYRTAGAGEQAVQGSGLGLSIVRTIVDQHHGTISLDSTPQVGTVVTIAIPGALPEDADTSAP